ncbi:pirin-like protein [Halalkalibacter wakoensis JCM 9140]|uniref:Pirin-like protein n=1 Tax=Halalkalibacter wakoensis JCM 9140 TaxID=1236970 RepID=W4Q459_9BACI|nr:hypothetical protein [Halalkalibacter wakoensis]GAE26772.1 pirin-like protein [Halalkalibacter wakoensis JCM 9140]
MEKEVGAAYKRSIKDHLVCKVRASVVSLYTKRWILPVERWADFDPFILMAEDWFKRGAFSDHPHRGVSNNHVCRRWKARTH